VGKAERKEAKGDRAKREAKGGRGSVAEGKDGEGTEGDWGDGGNCGGWNGENGENEQREGGDSEQLVEMVMALHETCAPLGRIVFYHSPYYCILLHTITYIYTDTYILLHTNTYILPPTTPHYPIPPRSHPKRLHHFPANLALPLHRYDRVLYIDI
jgi:hypothetical protein